MKYKLIRDLPDVEKGVIFVPNIQGNLYYAYYGPKILIYTDKVIKNKEWFKKI